VTPSLPAPRLGPPAADPAAPSPPRFPADLLPTIPASEARQRLAPSLPAAGGCFNAYGRCYLDGTHIELATAEAADPVTLATLIEQQQQLAAQACARLRDQGLSVTLANCNHAGLLTDRAPTWGAHGNYLVSEPPQRLADRLLPFLATRVYAGAGGIHWPSGACLAGVRMHFLKCERGGGTTQDRAIHSTAREEPLNPDPARFGHRYHTVLGDGLRSQFSQWLRFGVTALVLHAVTERPADLVTLPAPPGPGSRSFWLAAARRFNRLDIQDGVPIPEPLALDVQRVYLALVDRWLDSRPDAPPWMRQTAVVWESTLDALARRDGDWLGQRLDPWIKFTLFAESLRRQGLAFADLPRLPDVACGLALLNQDYHDFTTPQGLFARCEASGWLKHRIVPRVRPGDEPEPFVPATGSRGTSRARFIRAHAGERDWVADWGAIVNRRTGAAWRGDDPLGDDLAGRPPDPG